MEYSLSTAGSVTNHYRNINSLLKDSVPNNLDQTSAGNKRLRSGPTGTGTFLIYDLLFVVSEFGRCYQRVPIKRDGSNTKCSGFVDGSTWPKLQQISFYYCDRYQPYQPRTALGDDTNHSSNFFSFLLSGNAIFFSISVVCGAIIPYNDCIFHHLGGGQREFFIGFRPMDAMEAWTFNALHGCSVSSLSAFGQTLLVFSCHCFLLVSVTTTLFKEREREREKKCFFSNAFFVCQ